MKKALPRGIGFFVFLMVISDKRRGRAVVTVSCISSTLGTKFIYSIYEYKYIYSPLCEKTAEINKKYYIASGTNLINELSQIGEHNMLHVSCQRTISDTYDIEQT